MLLKQEMSVSDKLNIGLDSELWNIQKWFILSLGINLIWKNPIYFPQFIWKIYIFFRYFILNTNLTLSVEDTTVQPLLNNTVVDNKTILTSSDYIRKKSK